MLDVNDIEDLTAIFNFSKARVQSFDFSLGMTNHLHVSGVILQRGIQVQNSVDRFGVGKVIGFEHIHQEMYRYPTLLRVFQHSIESQSVTIKDLLCLLSPCVFQVVNEYDKVTWVHL